MNKFLKIIDEALTRKGISAAAASKLAVGNPSLIKSMKAGSVPSLDKAEKLAKVLGIDFHYNLPTEYIEEPQGEVILWGDIAAGGGNTPADGEIIMAEQAQYDTTNPPPVMNDQDISKWGGMLALRVKGQSMYPKYADGDTIYIYSDDPLRFSPDQLIGRECAIICSGDHEGKTYLKRLRRPDNNRRGYYNLESINLEWPVMVNMPIDYIYPIRYTKHQYQRT